eukprot:scaffold319997_cov28-Tisochrysis_lutea.AAC.1
MAHRPSLSTQSAQGVIDGCRGGQSGPNTSTQNARGTIDEYCGSHSGGLAPFHVGWLLLRTSCDCQPKSKGPFVTFACRSARKYQRSPITQLRQREREGTVASEVARMDARATSQVDVAMRDAFLGSRPRELAALQYKMAHAVLAEVVAPLTKWPRLVRNLLKRHVWGHGRHGASCHSCEHSDG